MHERGSRSDARIGARPAWLVHLRQIISEGSGQSAVSDWLKTFAIKRHQVTEGCGTEPHRLFEHCVEHGRELARRAIDDLQYLGGGRLLLQGLSQGLLGCLAVGNIAG